MTRRRRPPSRERRQHWRDQALVLINMAAVIDQTIDHRPFAGDFVMIAAGLGWTSGVFWKQNPAIRVARAAYAEAGGDLVRAATIVREASGKGIRRMVSAGYDVTMATNTMTERARAEA